jgi:alkylation response protein AidB-like acyl-CoA dehydrogenase
MHTDLSTFPRATIGDSHDKLAAFQELLKQIASENLERERGELPAHTAISRLKAIKYGALRLPVAQGGWGLRLSQLFEMTIGLAEADPNIPHILRNHFFLVEKILRSNGYEKYTKWIGPVAEGVIFGSGATELGTQEIGGGAVETTVRQDGDVFYLNGKKFYGTGNLYSDILWVHARLVDGDDVFVMVRADQKGLTIKDDWDGIGQRLTASGTTIFDNVRISEEHVILSRESGPKLPFESTFLQLYLTSIIAGILKRVVSDATNVIKQRDRNFYHAVAKRPTEDPILQQTIGRLASVAYVAEASVLRAADALEAALNSAMAGNPDEALFIEASLRAAKSKIIIDELALTAATQLFDVGGASAARQNKGLDRHWRNIRTIASHNPVSYKARAVGDFLVNDTPLPGAAYF